MRTVIVVVATALIAAACAEGPTPAAPAARVIPDAAANVPTSSSTKVTPDLIKKAASVGYFPRTRGGVAVYCRTDSDIGTRFTTEKCINEDQLSEVVLRAREVQDNMRKGGACGTPNCGN